MQTNNFKRQDFNEFKDMDSLNLYLDKLSISKKNSVTKELFNLSYYEYEKVFEFIRKHKKYEK